MEMLQGWALGPLPDCLGFGEEVMNGWKICVKATFIDIEEPHPKLFRAQSEPPHRTFDEDWESNEISTASPVKQEHLYEEVNAIWTVCYEPNFAGPMSNNDLKTTTETTETASAETQTAGEFSQGSRGHPEFCKRPCVHFFTRGCAAGAGCNYCHAEHPKRPTSLDKSQRRLLVKVEEQHLLEIVMGHLRARAEHFGFGSPCEELFQILETRWKGLDPDVPASWSPSEQQNMRRVLGKMTFAGLLGLVLSRSSTEDGGTLFAQDVNHALERLREVMPTINQH